MITDRVSFDDPTTVLSSNAINVAFMGLHDKAVTL